MYISSSVEKVFFNLFFHIRYIQKYFLISPVFFETMFFEERSFERGVCTCHNNRRIQMRHIYSSLCHCRFFFIILVYCCLHIHQILHNQENAEKYCSQSFLHMTPFHHVEVDTEVSKHTNPFYVHIWN